MKILISASAVFCCLLPFAGLSAQILAPQAGDYPALRQRLINDVLVPGGVTDPRVLDAIRQTDRHEFVAQELRDQAYADRALPIGASQTISSPYIVAIMTQQLDTQPDQKVLEIGTGSGYQAAVLSPLVKEVYTIEIVPQLGEHAKEVLDSLGYKNVEVKVGDGFQGWIEHAPFDRIIVTCSPEDVPQPLVDQLAEGGLMIIPVGERYQQTLYLMRKKDGKLQREALQPTLFVPMTGKAEDERRVHADPENPSIVNSAFDEPLLDSGNVPGWYYGRELTLKSRSNSPKDQFVQFDNDVPGRPSHLMQGFAIDGRSVTRLKLSAKIMVSGVRQGLHRDEVPLVTIRYYDQQRSLLGTQYLGPFTGSRTWRNESKAFRVPRDTHEAIVSIGLFGATGTAAFDDVEIQPLK